MIVQCTHDVLSTYYDIYSVWEFKDIVLSFFFPCIFCHRGRSTLISFLLPCSQTTVLENNWSVYSYQRCTINSEGGRIFFLFLFHLFRQCCQSWGCSSPPTHQCKWGVCSSVDRDRAKSVSCWDSVMGRILDRIVRYFRVFHLIIAIDIFDFLLY